MKIIKYHDTKELNDKLEKTLGKLAHREISTEGSISTKLHSVVQLIQENRALIDNSNDPNQLLEFIKSAKKIEDLSREEHSEEDAEALHRCMIAATGALLTRNDPADKATLSGIDQALYYEGLAEKIKNEGIMLDRLQLTQEETMQLAPYLTYLQLSVTNEKYDSAFIRQFLGKTEKLEKIVIQALPLEADAFELLEKCEKLETIELYSLDFNGPLPANMPSLKKIQLMFCRNFNHAFPNDLPALESLSIRSCRSFNQPLPEEMRSLTELTISSCPSFNQPLPGELGSLKQLKLSNTSFNQPLPEYLLNIETCELSEKSLNFMHFLRLLHPLYLENKERAKEVARKTFGLYDYGLIALYPFIVAHPGYEEEIKEFARFLNREDYTFLEKKNVPPSIEEALKEDPVQKLRIYQLCSKMPEGHSMEDIEAFLNLIIKTPMDETLKEFYFFTVELNNQIIPLPAHALLKNAPHEKRLQYMEYLDLSSPSNEVALQNLENLEKSGLIEQFQSIFKNRPPILSTQGLFIGDSASDKETLALLHPQLLLELEPQHAEALLKSVKGREFVEMNLKQFFEINELQELLLKAYPPEDMENQTIYSKMPAAALLQWKEETATEFLKSPSGRAFIINNVDQIHNTPALMTMLLQSYPLENPENMEIYSKMHPAGLLQWEVGKAIGFLLLPSGRDYLKNNLRYILSTPDLIKMLITAYPPEDVQNIDLYLSFDTFADTLYLTLLQNIPFEHPDVLMDVFRRCKDVNRLSIKFIDSQGIDAGGLGRQFVSQIVQGIVSRSNDMKFAKSVQGMSPRPNIPTKVSAKEIELFETLGCFFALAMKMGYPTGEVFHPQWLECVRRFNASSFNDEPFNTDAFFSSMSHQELSRFMHEAVPHDEPSMMKLFENADRALCLDDKDVVTQCSRELNQFWESDELAQAIDEGNIDAIRTVVREEWIYPQKGYIELSRAVAKGLHQSLPEGIPQIEFSKSLQGTLSADDIKGNLTFEGADGEQTDKVKTWILAWLDAHKNDKSALANLLQYLTGARGISRPITFNFDPNVEGVFPHTCFYKVDLPANIDEATLNAAFDEFSKSSDVSFNQS